ncbi:hypothetical protein C7Y70_20510 [Pseudoalteromonas sp. KS88]|uniref:glycosyltransferase family 4 protein n=1 Tax=Pseudoalteromonas sp. KS88 TaxID=2109918 RepID=UPI00108007C6|nr:glycosyltransferase [Pseudoalteromonas sp. KS88]TGE75714.1 hypothetical protein C7Y70_20510 [Pseudoalteromonas sp. KS88]
MKNILIVYNEIQHYREDFFNELSKECNLTVLHSGSLLPGTQYKQIRGRLISIGPLKYQFGVTKEILFNRYDAVIFLFNVAWLSNLVNALIVKLKPKTKSILWGAWYTKSKAANLTRDLFSKLADSNIFYSPRAQQQFVANGLKREKAFVANNTFNVPRHVKAFNYDDKFRFLFVGSLNKRKDMPTLIHSFKEVLPLIPKNICLTIIGSGEERRYLESVVESLDLDKRVKFLGKIEDSQILEQYYRESLASISYGQAGLSVLQSLGFGTPFITKLGAISGGEIENIKSSSNGFMCKNKEELKDVLTLLGNDLDLAQSLGLNAYRYYEKYCTIENMASGFLDAIDSTERSTIDFEH